MLNKAQMAIYKHAKEYMLKRCYKQLNQTVKMEYFVASMT